MMLDRAIQMYADDLRAEGKARTTRKQYAARLRAFERWLRATGAQPTTADFSETLLASYVSSLHANGLRPRTVCGVIFALTSFGKWLHENNHALTNPAARLKKPKLDAPRRELASDAEIAQLLAACALLPKARRAKMAGAVLAVFAFCAVRRAELLNLKLDDLNLSDGAHGSLIVRQGKGSKARTIPLAHEVRAALVDWLAVRGDCSHRFVFDVDHTRRLADAGLRNLLRDVAAVAGMRDATNILPHSIRHNCATRLLRNGADVPTVQKLLGHTNPYTTFVYLHGDEGRLRDLADAGAFSLTPQAAPPLRLIANDARQTDRTTDRTKAAPRFTRREVRRG